MARNSTKTGSRSSSSKSRGSSSKSRGSSSKRSNASKSRGSSNGKDETERYRQAAEDALQQLDWTIGYLHGIKKTEISKALAQNRSFIRRNLMGMPEEPLPDQETDET
jgi:hypothetical protein